jgi:hypothetical protein
VRICGNSQGKEIDHASRTTVALGIGGTSTVRSECGWRGGNLWTRTRLRAGHCGWHDQNAKPPDTPSALGAANGIQPHSGRLAQLVLALLAIFLGDDLGFFAATTLLLGVRIRTVMKCGFVFAQASAFCLVSKNRSMTMALRSAAFRPHERAALRLTTSDPVSTARHVASGKATLLP